jgi:hypothetical protein
MAFIGATAFWSYQANVSPGQLWPLPALILLEWGLIGFLGMVLTQAQETLSQATRLRVPWLAAGALAPMAYLGGFSIGPTVAISMWLFLGVGLLMALRRKALAWRLLLWLGGAVLANLALLLLVIALSL